MAGTGYSVGISKTTSGFPIFQPSTHLSGAGASLESPARAPASTHATSFRISDSFRRLSLAKRPYCGSANQGGIFLTEDCGPDRLGPWARALLAQQRHRSDFPRAGDRFGNCFEEEAARRDRA